MNTQTKEITMYLAVRFPNLPLPGEPEGHVVYLECDAHSSDSAGTLHLYRETTRTTTVPYREGGVISDVQHLPGPPETVRTEIGTIRDPSYIVLAAPTLGEARANVTEPLRTRNFKFRVQVQTEVTGTDLPVMSVTGLSVAGPTTFISAPLELRRAVVTGRDEFYLWHATKDARDLRIAVLNHPDGAVRFQLLVKQAKPESLEYSDLDAGANQLLIERLTLGHQGITPDYAPR